MRFSEINQREDFLGVLLETLANGWSEQYRTSIRILPAGMATRRDWLAQPLLSACYRRTLCNEGRQYLRNAFRYTHVRWRAPMKWLLGTTITTALGLRLTAQPLFRVDPDLGVEDQLLVVPGNQRVRVFDFGSGKCRVFLKRGFDQAGMAREIGVRGEGKSGPFPTLTDWDPHGSWFEEPILDAWALPRCPSAANRRRSESRAFELLHAWLMNSQVPIDVDERVQDLYGVITTAVDTLTQRFDSSFLAAVPGWAEVLCERSCRLRRIPVAETHGDFQPGNVLVKRGTGDVLITDWEYSGQRYLAYDYLVYQLRSRFPKGLAGRLVQFISNAEIGESMPGCPSGRVGRQNAIALFLLEDLAWYLHANAVGPFKALSASLTQYITELSLLGPRLEALFCKSATANGQDTDDRIMPGFVGSV